MWQVCALQPLTVDSYMGLQICFRSTVLCVRVEPQMMWPLKPLAILQVQRAMRLPAASLQKV